MVEFAVEGSISFSEVERNFFCGPIGRYINLVSFWIKMILCDRGLMSVENDTISD